MGIYRTYVLPRLMNAAMQSELVKTERAKLIPLAGGRVLEVGIGSGLNIPFYSNDLEVLVGLDPSGALWQLGQKRAAAAPFPVEHIEDSGERIPLDDETFDTIVVTWTLCSIPDAESALLEMRRVVKPTGRLIFIEHGLAPERRIQTWQNRLNPVWTHVAGGCNINRKMNTLITQAQFEITQIETDYLKGPKPISFMYKGIAHPA